MNNKNKKSDAYIFEKNVLSSVLNIVIYATSLRCWMVGCFRFNGPLRQYFSLYWAVSQRQGERKMIDERNKSPNNTHPHLLLAQKVIAPQLSKSAERPGTESYLDVVLSIDNDTNPPPPPPPEPKKPKYCLHCSLPLKLNWTVVSFYLH